MKILDRYTNNKEVEFLKKNVGKDILIALPHRKLIIGKLLDVNTDNLTLYLETDDDALVIVPYNNKHISYIKFMNHKVKRKEVADVEE